MKALGVIYCDKPGKYIICKQAISKQEIVSFMVQTLLHIDNGGYYSLLEVNSSSYFFPFEYHIEKETLLQDEHFAISNIGGELSIVSIDC